MTRIVIFGGALTRTATLLFALLATAVCPAQTPTETPGAAGAAAPAQPELAIDSLQTRITALESAANLDESRRATLLGHYRQALDALQRARAVEAEAQTFAATMKEASTRTREISDQLAKPTDPDLPPEKAAETMSLDAVSEELARRSQALTNEREQLQNLQTALRDLANRPAELRTLIQDRDAKMADLQAQFESPAATDEAIEVTEARRAALEARRRLHQAELNAYRNEDANHEARMELRRHERDLAEQNVTALETAVQAWQEVAAEARRREAAAARRQAEDATSQASLVPGEFAEMARDNVDLGSELQNLTQAIQILIEQKKKSEDKLQDIREELSLARRRAETAGQTKATGLLLREQKNRLPEPEEYRLSDEETQRQITKSATRQIELEATRREVTDYRETLDRYLGQVQEDLSDKERKQLRESMVSILETRRSLISRLQAAYGQQSNLLGDLEYANSQIAATVREFEEFADEQLLWIPSLAPLVLTDFGDVAGAVTSVLRPNSWHYLGSQILAAFRLKPLRWLIAVPACLLLFLGVRQFTRGHGVSQAGWPTHRPRSFAEVLKRLLLAAELSLGPPIIMGLIGYLLSDVPAPSDLTRALSFGLITAAAIQATLRFARALLEDGAIGATEFEWPEKARRAVRGNMTWLTSALAPLWGIAYGISVVEDAVAMRSLGPLFLVPGAVAIVAFVLRALSLRGPVMGAATRLNRKHWFYSLRYLWMPAAVAAPGLIVVLSPMGYHYTALELGWRLLATAWLTLGLVILKHLLLSWLRRTHLAVLFEQAEHVRQDMMRGMPQGAPREAGAGTDELAAPRPEEPQARLAELNQRARELLRTLLAGAALVSLWLLWAPVLPFLSSIGSIPIWAHTVTDAGQTTETVVNLAHILMAIVAAVVVMSAARHLPYLLELVLLRHMEMEEGTRYAVTTLSRYTIIAAGIVLAAKPVGIGWDQVQWLIAALGIGLGFGLQEVVANFVSGIIILFERPMRVGDIVTVGEISGKVTRIQIRATTITDWDRKELIVPNKSFITGDLINWSLSDPIVRLRLVIGIAYGSDTRLAEKLLLKAAEENENVLDDPAPRALFLEFGDNSLAFHLLVFLPGVDNLYTTKHQLNMAIDDAFREAGICIAFPQRDTHLDTLRPLDIRIVRDGESPYRAGGNEQQPS